MSSAAMHSFGGAPSVTTTTMTTCDSALAQQKQPIEAISWIALAGVPTLHSAANSLVSESSLSYWHFAPSILTTRRCSHRMALCLAAIFAGTQQVLFNFVLHYYHRFAVTSMSKTKAIRRQ
jgi:hypothetical protein